MEVLAEPFTTSDNTIFPLAPNTVTYTIPKSSANTRDNSFDESSRNASIDEKAGMGSLLGSLCLPPSLLSKSILSIFSAANRGMAKQKAVKKYTIVSSSHLNLISVANLNKKEKKDKEIGQIQMDKVILIINYLKQ